MLYVIQTTTGDEELVIKLIKKELENDETLKDCFTPSKIELAKFRGKWNKVKRLVFPSYVFIDTDNISDIYNHFFNIPYLTKLLGIDKKKKEIVPLFKEEEEFIYNLIGKSNDHEIELSEIYVLDNKQIKVLSGPLKGLEGKVIKTDLHKRRVNVLVPLLGQLVDVSLGIDIVERID